jgi:hypothetical protein
MKKVLSLAVAVLLSFALCNAQAVVTTSDPATLVASTDFESGYTVGAEVNPVNASNIGSFDWGGTGQMWMYSDGVVANDGGNKVLLQKYNAMSSDDTFAGYDSSHNLLGKYIGPESNRQVTSFSFKMTGTAMNSWICIGDTWGRPQFADIQIAVGDATAGTYADNTGLRLWNPGTTLTGNTLVQASAITAGWHNVELYSNMFTQTVSVAFDGVVVGQNIPFYNAGGPIPNVGSVADGAGPVSFFEMVSAGPDQQVELDNIDLYQVTPEPATMSLLALGGIALIKRSRK